MTRDEIIKMAKQAGAPNSSESPSFVDFLEAFAKLVVEAEREACALLVDANAKRCSHNSQAQMILYANATAIRARGAK